MAALEAQPASGVDPLGLVGETVAGRFRVDQLVAEGGFGIVYRAWQVGLDRAVALKVLKAPAARPGAQADDFQRVFHDEARTIARLEHPNIVAVHDFGVSERPSGEALHWIAFQWLEGRTLETLLVDRRAAVQPPYTPAEALALMRPVLQGMAFAHQRGIAHRDLKPANVFLHQQNARQVPKILDFGIAQMLSPDEPPPGPGTATAPAGVAFSPDYAAPEQVARARTGPFTDVHALGLIMTELLTGQPPYQGVPLGACDPEAEDRYEKVIALSRPTPGSKGVGVGSWERVLAGALARRPAERPVDAGALLIALERSLPAASRPEPPPEQPRPRPWWRRPSAVLAGMAALLVLALPLWLTLRSSPPERLVVAVLPFENLTGDPDQEYFSDGLTEEMIGQLGRLLPERLAVIARTSVIPYKKRDKSVKEIGRELNVAYLLESSVKRPGGRVRVTARLVQVSDETQVWSDSFDREVKDIVDLQSDIARAIAGELRLQLRAEPARSPSRGRPPSPAAYDAYLRGRFYLSRWGVLDGTFQRAGPYLQQAIALEPSYAAAHAAMAEFLGPRGMERGNEAKASALRALELDEQLPEAHRALANVLLAFDWDWAGAERHYRRALVLNPNDAQTHQQWARIPLATGRFGEGIAARRRATDLSPLSWDAQIQVASAYYNAGRYDEARDHLHRVLAHNPDLPLAHFFLGAVYVEQRRYPEALAEGAKCGASTACLGRVTGPALAGLGRNDEALAAIVKLTKATEVENGRELDVANVYAALGRRDDALAWLAKAVERRARDLIFLRVDPRWNRLRGDPRFQDLVRRVGIPAG